MTTKQYLLTRGLVCLSSGVPSNSKRPVGSDVDIGSICGRDRVEGPVGRILACGEACLGSGVAGEADRPCSAGCAVAEHSSYASVVGAVRESGIQQEVSALDACDACGGIYDVPARR